MFLNIVSLVSLEQNIFRILSGELGVNEKREGKKNLYMAFTVVEQALVGKVADSSSCEDALVITPGFAAVIDGATSKSPLRFSGKTTGRVAAELLCEVVATLPVDATLDKFVAETGERFIEFYRHNGILERVTVDPSCRLAASVAVYSDVRREVWSVGDCRVRIADKVFMHEKAVDVRLAGKRAAAIEAYLSQGSSLDALRVHDVGRMAIENELREQLSAQNNPGVPEAYGVIDGFTPYAADVHCYRVEPGSEVVLSTDGYPLPLSTLSAAEHYLGEILRDDPLCFRRYKSTKGRYDGYLSFDDRAYVRLRVDSKTDETKV